MRTSVGFAVLAACSSFAAAQCQPWNNITNDGPSSRQNHNMVSSGSAVYLFGGQNANVFSSQTWRWDASSGEPAWSLLAPSNSPAARGNFSMAYDTLRNRVIVFGGAGPGGVALGDTWAFDGADWTDLAPPNAPTARFNTAMAYDAANDRMVLFGGFGGSRFNQTWLFDGATWTQASPATVPIARNGHAMAYDPARQRVVMFGGYRGGSIGSIASFLNDTWEWNGSDWTLSPATGPSARQYLAMAYDQTLGMVVLSCGSNINSTKLNDTWAYDGASWIQLTDVATPGPIRDQHAMAFLDGTMLYGGYGGGAVRFGDTWILACPDVPTCDPDVNCDGVPDQGDVACIVLAVAGELSCFCQPNSDFNGDGVPDQGDVEAVMLTVAGAPCP